MREGAAPAHGKDKDVPRTPTVTAPCCLIKNRCGNAWTLDVRERRDAHVGQGCCGGIIDAVECQQAARRRGGRPQLQSQRAGCYKTHDGQGRAHLRSVVVWEAEEVVQRLAWCPWGAGALTPRSATRCQQ